MAAHTKELLNALKLPLHSLGFLKSGPTWTRDGDEVYCVFNVQTSQWSERYYFNVGVCVKAIFGGLSPKIADCHFSERVPQGEELRAYDLLADFSMPTPSAEERIARLSELIPAMATAWFARHDTLDRLNAQASHSPKATLALRRFLESRR